nr:unnamed protein product [Callosobruchus chinensis]
MQSTKVRFDSSVNQS